MNENFNKYNKTPSNFCILPYLHKAIDGNGDFKPCCVADPHMDSDGAVANINFIKFDDFIKSNINLDFKKSFQNNQRHSICQKCWDIDDQGGESHRKRALAFFMSKSWENGESPLYKLLESYFEGQVAWSLIQEELDQVNAPWDLEIEPGTTCNFKCHFCGPHASSSWISDQKELYGTSAEEAAKATKMGHWALDSELWNSEVMYNAKKFHFMGGEPMLINAHFEFLKKLSLRPDSDKIVISYNTNASKLPPEYALTNVYKKFKSNRVAFSIDAIGTKFHYQRYPGDWTEAESNMTVWVNSIRSNIEAKIDPGWSILNLLYIAELFLWADKFKKTHALNDKQFDFDGHYYFGPHYCPQSLTPEQKKLYKEKMTADIELLRVSNLDDRLLHRAEVTYKNMLDHMMAADTWSQAVENERNYRIKGLDRIRKQRLDQYMPEVNDILKLYV